MKANKGIVAGLKAIYEKGAPFVSRGDKSGTHSAELALWMPKGIQDCIQWDHTVSRTVYNRPSDPPLKRSTPRPRAIATHDLTRGPKFARP